MKSILEFALEHQISVFGHLAKLPNDPAHRILSCAHPTTGWKLGRGRPPQKLLNYMEMDTPSEEDDLGKLVLSLRRLYLATIPGATKASSRRCKTSLVVS